MFVRNVDTHLVSFVIQAPSFIYALESLYSLFDSAVKRDRKLGGGVMYFPLSVNVCRVLHVLIDFLNLFSLQPPNDPHGITREELVQALRAVLTGTPNFAEVSESIIYLCFFSNVVYFFCFGAFPPKQTKRRASALIFVAILQFLLPLLIEKLDSDVQSAKLDSLQTLVRNSSLKMLCASS